MWGKCLDGILLVFTNILVFGKFFPLLGMPQELVLPLFIGNTTLLLFMSLGFTMAISIVIEALHEGHATFEYLFTLPCPKKWVFVYYALSFVIETALITLPLLVVGVLFLDNNGAQLLMNNVLIFLPVYFIGLTAIAIFFLALSFSYKPLWFIDHVWPRRLGPAISFSSAFFPWKLVASYAPVMGTVLLLNPMTYITESIRGALLPGALHIPIPLCLGAVALFIILSCYILQKGVYKQLDPV